MISNYLVSCSRLDEDLMRGLRHVYVKYLNIYFTRNTSVKSLCGKQIVEFKKTPLKDSLQDFDMSHYCPQQRCTASSSGSPCYAASHQDFLYR